MTTTPTDADVKALVVSLLPPGAANLYSLADDDGGTGDYFGAIAAALKSQCVDMIETLRRNVNPLTADAKLHDWEAANGTSATKVSQYGTTAERQAQLASKFREYGASYLDNIRAAVQPYFKYNDPSLIQIIEVPRASLTALHTYSWTADVIPALGAYSKTVFVTDQGDVSEGGAQVWVNLTIALVQDLQVVLMAPSGQSYVLADFGDLGTGAVTDEQFQFWCAECAGEAINGLWTLSVINQGAGAGTVNTGAPELTQVFVEGVGRIVFSDVQGLGSQIFEFAVVFDPSLAQTSSPDLYAARAALTKLQPAHTEGYVVQVMSGGSICAIVDDASAVVSACVVC